MVGDLTALEEHVQRHDHGARLQDPVVDGGEVGQVGARECHLVTGPDAAADKQVRDLVGEGVQALVVEADVAQHDRVAVGVAAGGVLEEYGGRLSMWRSLDAG